MNGMTFIEMLKISIAMPILLILSLVIFAQALERLYSYWVVQKMPVSMWERVRDRLEAGDKAGAIAISRRDTTLMGEAITRLLSLETANTEKLVEAFQLYRQRLSLGLNRRVGLFGTASFISPLIGLMGTVLGIMRAFHDLSAAGAGGPAVVAAGISEALVATAFGIGLAVVAALFYNYFTLTARHHLNTADLWVLEMAQLLENTDGRQPVS